MQNQNNIFDELSIVFSGERLAGYLRHTACNNNKSDALVAYSWNIKLSQALYPALQVFENYSQYFISVQLELVFEFHQFSRFHILLF